MMIGKTTFFVYLILFLSLFYGSADQLGNSEPLERQVAHGRFL